MIFTNSPWCAGLYKVYIHVKYVCSLTVLCAVPSYVCSPFNIAIIALSVKVWINNWYEKSVVVIVTSGIWSCRHSPSCDSYNSIVTSNFSHIIEGSRWYYGHTHYTGMSKFKCNYLLFIFYCVFLWVHHKLYTGSSQCCSDDEVMILLVCSHTIEWSSLYSEMDQHSHTLVHQVGSWGQLLYSFVMLQSCIGWVAIHVTINSWLCLQF